MGSCEDGNEFSGSIKVSEWLLASKRLCSMELTSKNNSFMKGSSKKQTGAIG
jgi:hypothetical protein